MPRVLIVGEAWGQREAQMQHPLVGPTGRELSLMLGISKFAPYLLTPCRHCKTEVEYIDSLCPNCKNRIWPNEFGLIEHWKRLRNTLDIHLTNVFNVQPPANNLGHFFGTERETEMPAWKANKDVGGSHLMAEHFHHVKRLWNEIESLKPINLILALGNAACWATLFQTKISTLRGTVDWSEKFNVKVLPTFHPANILREPVMRPTVLADFSKGCREREFPEIRRPERWLTIPEPSDAGITEIYSWFRRPTLAYANDIETHKGLITIVGFARSRDDALVIPFRRQADEHYWTGPNEAEMNFWPTEELEFQAWKAVQYGLDTPQEKIFQNGLYDISWYLRMGLQVRNARHDTMLWHHSKYPELPKSLGYLGSIYANEIAWKSMRHVQSNKRDE